MATLGARMTRPGGSSHLHHRGDAGVDGEVETEDISEEEAKEEEKKKENKKRCARIPYFQYGYFYVYSLIQPCVAGLIYQCNWI